MGRALELRSDYDGKQLRLLAKTSRDAKQTRRLLSLAVIYDGGSRQEAARMGGVGVQIVRDWVERFNAEGPDGLFNRPRSGRPSKLNDEQRKAMIARIETGPLPAVDGVVRWRLQDIAHWLYEEYRISLSEVSIGRELKALGYTKLTARPQHYAQNEYALEAFKKTSAPK